MSGEIGEEIEEAASGPSSRPSNFVAAVIDDGAEFEQALEELLAAGVARESVAILQGERGAEAIARRGATGFKSWLRRTGEMLSDELLATASPDGTVALHLLPIDELRELARERVTCSLTDEECRQYLHVDRCPGA